MLLHLSLQSAQRHPRCVAALLLAVVLVQALLNCQAAYEELLQVHSQAGLHRLPVMAQRLLHLCYKPLRVVLQAAPQKECVLQDQVPVDPEVQAQVVLVDQAERRSHRLRYGSSHSWVICSSEDQST